MIKTSPPQNIPQPPSKALETQAHASMEQLAKGVEPLTHQHVLQLQRTIGNQRVQRLIGSHRANRSSIQRTGTDDGTKMDAPANTDEGLMGQDSSTRYAQKMYAITSNPKNARMTVSDLRLEMERVLNEELTPMGLPHVPIAFGPAGGNRAWFRKRPWLVEMNVDNVFGGEDKCLKDLDRTTLTDAVGTAYHEGRHAEQFFRVAQLYAFELKRALVPAKDLKTAMLKHLNMHPTTIDKAIALPLDEKIDPALLKKILLWKDSFYAANSDYSDIIYNMEKKVLNGLRSNIEALIAFVPENYDALPQEQRDPISQQLLSIRIAIKTHGDRLVAYRQDKLQPELDRLLALPIEVPAGNNKTMFDHLVFLIERVNAIEENIRLSPNPSSARRLSELINGQIELLKIELLEANYDLPDQADAEEAEAEVEKAFAELLDQ